MPIKTQSAKAKGRNLQKWVRSRLLRYFPILADDDIQSRSMGSGGTDLMLSPAAQFWVGLSVECKKTKKTPSVAELEQSRANAYKNTLPCVVWCPHGKGPQHTMIMFNLEEFLTEWSERNEQKSTDHRLGPGDDEPQG